MPAAPGTPPGTPPSPSASLYAQSDDEEDEYDTIRHTKSSKGVKLLFSKSKVYVHPSPSAKDNIPGFIALIRQRGPSTSDSTSTSTSSSTAASLLLAWVPESTMGLAYDTYVKVDLFDSTSPPNQSYLVPPPPTVSPQRVGVGSYAFAVPVSDVYSLLVRPPSIGWWFGSLVINTRSGDSFPALFFHDSECQSTILQRKKIAKESFDPFSDGGGMFWGGDEVLRWLKQYITVERSSHDMSVYLVDPSDSDRLGFAASASSAKNTQPIQNPDKSSKDTAAHSSSDGRRDASMDPVTKTLKEARWHFLEKLSQVTTFTRRTAQAVVDNPRTPPQVKRFMQNPEVQTLSEEFDSARLYLARWAMSIAEQSEREKRQRMWTAADVLEMEESAVGDFEILEMQAGNLSLVDKRKPLTLSEWNGFFDPVSGRLQITSNEVKERIFHGGLSPDDGVRKEAWLFLLGVYDWDSSTDERKAVMNSRRDDYIRLKGAWWERMAEGTGTLDEAEWWRDQRMRIEKDVHRTDRNIPLFEGEDIPHPDPDSPFAEVGTNVHLEQMKDMLLTYNEYNKDLGYVQGMSDLLAPIYAVMQDDAVAFWGFTGFMERMERNFLRDQSGMRLQLLTLDHLVQLMDPKLYQHLQKADSTNFFFFFRMLLVWFKREFIWADVLRLWETLWTDTLSSNYHLFIALAILEKHRAVIMEHLKQFDEVLKYINELSNTIDLPSTLIRAEALFRRFQRTVETVDKKHNFPAPSLRHRTSTQPTISSHLSNDSQQPQKQQAKQPQQLQPAKAASAASSSSSAAASSTTNNPRAKTPGANTSTTGSDPSEEDPPQVVSPELRQLLSRKVVKLDKKEIQKHGGGIN